MQIQGGEANNVQTLAEIAAGHDDRVAQINAVNVDLGEAGTQVATLAEATISPDGQIILTGEDGTQSSKCADHRSIHKLIVLGRPLAFRFPQRSPCRAW